MLSSSVRAYVVVVGVVLAAVVDTAVAVMVTVVVTGAVVVLWISSSSSGFVSVKDTFVGMPFGYRYLYPCEHPINVLLLAPNLHSRCLYGMMSFSSHLPFRH